MEVRWKATEILKQYLAKEESQNGIDIAALISSIVQNKLSSKDVYTKLIGINLACDFRSKIEVLSFS